MLAKLATFLHANGRRVLAATVLAAAFAGAFGFGVTGHLSPYGDRDPGTQSAQATQRFERVAGREIDPGVVALVDAGAVRSAAAHARVEGVARELRAEPDVAHVVSFYDTRNPAMVSRDGHSTYVIAYFKALSDKALKDVAQRIEKRFAGQRDVKLGGDAIASAQINSQVGSDLARAELLAFPFIFLLSLLFFRSVVASLLPPLLGGLVIVATFFALRVASSFANIDVFALNLVTGLGLGLAIDYSLFMVSRYREEAARSGFGLTALTRTLQTAGRTIVFSSLTIAAAIASLTIFPQRFLYSMGIAGALVALLAGTLALVALPAVLTVLGPRVNALAPAWLARAAEREARADERGAWYRLSRFVMRRPAPIAIAVASLLIALGIPFAGITFTEADASALPASASARQVSDALNRQFPPDRTAPLEVVVGAPARSAGVRALAAQIRALPDVSAVASTPVGIDRSLLQVAPAQGPLSSSAERLVGLVRAIHRPFYVGVTGQTASFVDLKHSLGAHLPAVLGIVIVATLVILFLLTGSVVLPVKAVLMNALNLSAVFGILVLIFKDGNLQDVLGFHAQAGLDATQPILLFAIGFGLSTDYGVFLLSRIKEARDGGAPNSEAVATGIERTGRITTAAALLFAVAIGASVTSSIVFIKELSVGAALAVLIDASVVRALLVPSLMALLGSANWWAPRPLRRIYERLGWREYGTPVQATSS